MSKQPVKTSVEIIKVLQRKSFVIDRIKGSHYILFNEESKIRVIVPFHKTDLPKGTIHEIIKQSGLKEEDFLS
jgi:predicted RNA binding protein YcfA (HicA-like mRNA interferase family)